MTLEQFRATGKDVADVGAYTDGNLTGPGRVYMEGTLVRSMEPEGRAQPGKATRPLSLAGDTTHSDR